MATLRILSAGAAQAVTERVIRDFKRQTGADVLAAFAAVGAIKSRVTSGEPADIIILTQAMINELAGAKHVVAGSRVDLGKVGTGVAVRAGAPKPQIATADQLRVSVLASTKIVCPDPAIATAGKVVTAMLEKLGAASELNAKGRLFFLANGYAAMNWLAQSGAPTDLGITQVTEILPNEGVTYVGPLPDAFQMKTVYSAAVAAGAAQRELAQQFVSRYATAAGRAMLAEAGYEAP